MRAIPLLGILTAALLSVPQARAEPPSPSVGRYQIVFSPTVRADTFLLDTATGTVWQSAKVSTNEVSKDAWVLMERIDKVLLNAPRASSSSDRAPAGRAPTNLGPSVARGQ
jgi:hypothetical protein